MYENTLVTPYREKDEILAAEGDLDNESDASDIDMDVYRSRPNSVTSSTGAEAGSPMVVSDSK
jgi:hypothetical protein